ncbi:hypothetical protein ASF91_07980 [Rhizobium sp. Leaf155]|nr:hypothetical protein ASF91_07980 [Rhizobium sp. Leaf155]
MAPLLKFFAGPEGTGSSNKTRANHITIGVPLVSRTKKRMKPNLQSTSFGAGSLFVHAVSATQDGLEPSPPVISSMMKIWPPRTMSLHWPLPFVTDDDMADTFGYMLGE